MPDRVEAESHWRLVHYISEMGRQPVKEWLEELSRESEAAFAEFNDVLLPVLRTHGPDIGAPHFERLSAKTFFKISDFAEIRWNGRDRAHYRIYCSIEPGRKLVFYHAVIKRWPRFSKGDKAICRERYNDYHSEGYDWNARQKRRAGGNSP